MLRLRSVKNNCVPFFKTYLDKVTIRSCSNRINVFSQPKKIATKEERAEYLSYLPKVLDDVTEFFPNVPDFCQHYRQLILKNSVGDHYAMGITLVKACKMLGSDATNDMRLANILGWCVDMTLGAQQIIDDIIDESETRRGAPCWYKRENVGLGAVNDALLLNQAYHMLLKKYFSNHYSYQACMECLNKMTLLLCLGQHLDCSSKANGRAKLDEYTMENYLTKVIYKGTYTGLIFPIRIGLHYLGKYSRHVEEQIKPLLFELGEFYVVQNDILDCFGIAEQTGKVKDEDIRGGRGSWVVTAALRRATQTQKQILLDHYGRDETESLLEIRNLYNEMNVLEEFHAYEDESFHRAQKYIENITMLPQQFFVELRNVTYGRPQ